MSTNYYEKFCEETGTKPREKDFNEIWRQQTYRPETHKRVFASSTKVRTETTSDAGAYAIMVEWTKEANEHAIELSWEALADVAAFKSKPYLWCVFLGKAHYEAEHYGEEE